MIPRFLFSEANTRQLLNLQNIEGLIAENLVSSLHCDFTSLRKPARLTRKEVDKLSPGFKKRIWCPNALFHSRFVIKVNFFQQAIYSGPLDCSAFHLSVRRIRIQIGNFSPDMLVVSELLADVKS